MLDLIIKNGKCYIDGDLKEVSVGVKGDKIDKIGEIHLMLKRLLMLKIC